MMTKAEKIFLALHQVDGIEALVKDLDYTQYLTEKCIKLRCELKRQLSLIKAGDDAVFDR